MDSADQPDQPDQPGKARSKSYPKRCFAGSGGQYQGVPPNMASRSCSTPIPTSGSLLRKALLSPFKMNTPTSRRKRPREARGQPQDPATVLKPTAASTPSIGPPISEEEQQRRAALKLPLVRGMDATRSVDLNRRYGPEHNIPHLRALPLHVEEGLQLPRPEPSVPFPGKLPHLPGPLQPAKIYSPVKPQFEKDVILPPPTLSNGNLYHAQRACILPEPSPIGPAKSTPSALASSSGKKPLQKTPAPDNTHSFLASSSGIKPSQKSLLLIASTHSMQAHLEMSRYIDLKSYRPP